MLASGAAVAQPASPEGDEVEQEPSPPEPSEQEKEACVDAHEATQSARGKGKLLDARRDALRCAAAQCPAILREECSGFLVQLDRDTPTVSLRARDAHGRDVLDVEVEVDGRPLTSKLEGTSLPLDPGRHRFRFAARGLEPVERTVLVVEGQKNQLVEVALTPREPPKPRPEPPTDPKLVAGLVIGGVGAAGLVAFAVLGGIGLKERGDLEQCRPCSDAEVAPVRTKLVAADVAMGSGLGLLAIGAVLVGISLGSDGPPSTGAALELVPVPDGGIAAIRGRF